MPQGHLDETYVRKAAVEWLANYYREKLNTRAIVPVIEKYVSKNSRLGNGRVDGLIAAQLDDCSIYTATIEAKSFRTWNNIKLGYHDDVWLRHAAVFGVLVLGIVMLAGITASGGLLWGIVVPSLVFIVAAFSFCIVTQNSSYYQKFDVINQIQRYPANEQWIALSTDVFNKLVRKNQSSAFIAKCANNGIGLIRISAGNKVNIINSPLSKTMPKNHRDFLDCYSVESNIRAMIRTVIKDGDIIAEPIIVTAIENTAQPSEVNEVAVEQSA
jgi:hypothetical protein